MCECAAGATGAGGWLGGGTAAGEPCAGGAAAEAVEPGVGSWDAPACAAEGVAGAPPGACRAGGWACSSCC